MSPNYTPYPPEDECPCGSLTSYRECCSDKDYEYVLEDEGHVFRQMQMNEEVRDSIVGAESQFKDLYQRAPGQKDLVFGHLADPTESVLSGARELLQLGLDPAYVFAYARTDGLMPTELNKALISDLDQALFEAFADQYLELTNPDTDGMSVLSFVATANALIGDTVDWMTERLRMVLIDFLSRHMSPTLREERMIPSGNATGDFSVRSPADYALFSALKTKRTLSSMTLLASGMDPASIYSLARSVFENTVYLDSIVDDPSVFWDGISPKTDTENFEFGTYPDGTVNYNHVIDRKTRIRARTNARFSDLAQAVKRSPHTRSIYSLFYVTASQYVHVDVLSARQYFHDPDPFEELDETLVASLVGVILVGDLLRALAASDGVDPQYAIDVRAFLDSSVDRISNAVECVNADSHHSGAIFDIFANLVLDWRK